MTFRITQVDSFTDTPFKGNPAAICVLPEAQDASWLQNVAREMNLSETAFLVRTGDTFNLRWFTPVSEVDLCGHATLAAAHVLWEEGHLADNEVAKFDTLSGRLEARRAGDWIEMDFPSEEPHEINAPPALSETLNSTWRYVGSNRLDYLVVLTSEDEVRNLKPDFIRMKELGMRGVIVTAMTDDASEYDFVSRYFAPLFGVDEEPVTGSAHCCLGPYWGNILGLDELSGFQASKRGGVVRVRLADDRVTLIGKAVTTMHGTLTEAAVGEQLASS